MFGGPEVVGIMEVLEGHLNWYLHGGCAGLRGACFTWDEPMCCFEEVKLLSIVGVRSRWVICSGCLKKVDTGEMRNWKQNCSFIVKLKSEKRNGVHIITTSVAVTRFRNSDTGACPVCKSGMDWVSELFESGLKVLKVKTSRYSQN